MKETYVRATLIQPTIPPPPPPPPEFVKIEAVISRVDARRLRDLLGPEGHNFALYDALRAVL